MDSLILQETEFLRAEQPASCPKTRFLLVYELTLRSIGIIRINVVRSKAAALGNVGYFALLGELGRDKGTFRLVRHHTGGLREGISWRSRYSVGCIHLDKPLFI